MRKAPGRHLIREFGRIGRVSASLRACHVGNGYRCQMLLRCDAAVVRVCFFAIFPTDYLDGYGLLSLWWGGVGGMGGEWGGVGWDWFRPVGACSSGERVLGFRATIESF